MKLPNFFFLISFLSFCLNLRPTTFMLYENFRGDDERVEFIDSIYDLIKKHDKPETFLCSNSLKKITSVGYLSKACSLALKILECDDDKIKIISFGRTFNIVFLTSMLLDEKTENLLMHDLHGKVFNLGDEKPFSFTPKDRVHNLCDVFDLMFKEYEKKGFIRDELDFTDEKGLQDVLFLNEFNDVFKFCRDNITELKKTKKKLGLDVVTLLAPNDRVCITIDKQEKEVQTNEFYFKPNENSIERVRNLYSEHGIGKILLGDQMLPFGGLSFNFLNIGIMNNEKDIIKNFVVHYLFDFKSEGECYDV